MIFHYANNNVRYFWIFLYRIPDHPTKTGIVNNKCFMNSQQDWAWTFSSSNCVRARFLKQTLIHTTWNSKTSPAIARCTRRIAFSLTALTRCFFNMRWYFNPQELTSCTWKGSKKKKEIRVCIRSVSSVKFPIL